MEDLYNPSYEGAYISPGARIGKNVTIAPFAYIGPNVVIGDNNYIGPYCMIGGAPESLKHDADAPHMGVVIGNGNIFTKQVTIDGGTERPTLIHNNTLWLKNAHAGHDCIVHDGVQVRCNAILGGFVEARKGSRFNLGVIVHPRLVIPEGCQFGMGCIVVKKTELISNAVYVGNPARFLRLVT